MSMSNSDCAKAYAQGKVKGSSNRMFIEGHTIYSYGYHFPIAVRLDDGSYLFNSDGYSSTTACHKSCVSSAIWGSKKLVLAGCNPDNVPLQIKRDKYTIENLKVKLKRARVQHMKDYYNEEIKDLKVNIQRLRAFDKNHVRCK